MGNNNYQRIIVSNNNRDRVKEIIEKYTPASKFHSYEKLELTERNILGYTIFTFLSYNDPASGVVQRILDSGITDFKYSIWEEGPSYYGEYRFQNGEVTFASKVDNDRYYGRLAIRLRRSFGYEIPYDMTEYAEAYDTDINEILDDLSYPIAYKTMSIKNITNMYRFIRCLPEFNSVLDYLTNTITNTNTLMKYTTNLSNHLTPHRLVDGEFTQMDTFVKYSENPHERHMFLIKIGDTVMTGVPRSAYRHQNGEADTSKIARDFFSNVNMAEIFILDKLRMD